MMRFESRQAVLIGEVSFGIQANDGPSQTHHIRQNPLAAQDWRWADTITVVTDTVPLLRHVDGVSRERGSHRPRELAQSSL